MPGVPGVLDCQDRRAIDAQQRPRLFQAQQQLYTAAGRPAAVNSQHKKQQDYLLFFLMTGKEKAARGRLFLWQRIPVFRDQIIVPVLPFSFVVNFDFNILTFLINEVFNGFFQFLESVIFPVNFSLI